MSLNLQRARTISGHMSNALLEWLARSANGCEEIIELGSLRGRSVRAMLDNSDAKIWCVDTWKYESNYQKFIANIQDVRDKVTILRMLTADGATQVPGPVDMVFIDAGHSYADVKQDILLYAPKLREGGLLCGHDYGTEYPGVAQAVDELLSDANKGPEILWWIRKPRGGFSFENA